MHDHPSGPGASGKRPRAVVAAVRRAHATARENVGPLVTAFCVFSARIFAQPLWMAPYVPVLSPGCAKPKAPAGAARCHPQNPCCVTNETKASQTSSSCGRKSVTTGCLSSSSLLGSSRSRCGVHSPRAGRRPLPPRRRRRPRRFRHRRPCRRRLRPCAVGAFSGSSQVCTTASCSPPAPLLCAPSRSRSLPSGPPLGRDARAHRRDPPARRVRHRHARVRRAPGEGARSAKRARREISRTDPPDRRDARPSRRALACSRAPLRPPRSREWRGPGQRPRVGGGPRLRSSRTASASRRRRTPLVTPSSTRPPREVLCSDDGGAAALAFSPPHRRARPPTRARRRRRVVMVARASRASARGGAVRRAAPPAREAAAPLDGAAVRGLAMGLAIWPPRRLRAVGESERPRRSPCSGTFRSSWRRVISRGTCSRASGWSSRSARCARPSARARARAPTARCRSRVRPRALPATTARARRALLRSGSPVQTACSPVAPPRPVRTRPSLSPTRCRS